MLFSTLSLLQVLIAFQSGLFALYLGLGQRGKRQANRCLGLLLALFAVQMATNVARAQGWVEGRVLLPQLFALLYGPLFYAFVRSLVWRRPRFAVEDVLHGIPFVTLVVLWIGDALPMRTLAIVIFASVGTYLALCWLAVRRYRQVVDQTTAQGDAVKLSWLRWALVLLAGVWIFDMVSFATSRVAPGRLEDGVTLALFLLLLGSVTAVVFQGLRHPEMFDGITHEDTEIARVGAEARRQATLQGPAPDAASGILVERLRQLMEEDQPHLDPELDLATLAGRLGLPARDLSRLINRNLGTNFSDFVNGYRIEAARSRLEDPADDATILDILHAVGFNSKSSFNFAFKRKTGLTPSQYRTRHPA